MGGRLSLLDGIAAVADSLLSGSDKQKQLTSAALSRISDPATGGLLGLVNTLRQLGLDDVVSSWISTGENKPISSEQVQNALGEGQINQVAQNMGVSHQEVLTGLAGLLPQLIDKLTPDGKLPESRVLDQGLELLKKRFLG
jgi:uncharacterized protein YidB (DUF937 family)